MSVPQKATQEGANLESQLRRMEEQMSVPYGAGIPKEVEWIPNMAEPREAADHDLTMRKLGNERVAMLPYPSKVTREQFNEFKQKYGPKAAYYGTAYKSMLNGQLVK